MVPSSGLVGGRTMDYGPFGALVVVTDMGLVPEMGFGYIETIKKREYSGDIFRIFNQCNLI